MKPSRLPTVVVPVFNALAVTRECLAALDRCSPDARVIIVNDASTEPGLLPLLRDWVARHPDRHLIDLPQNRGFVHAANRGAAEAEGDLVLLNSDTEVTPGWLEARGFVDFAGFANGGLQMLITIPSNVNSKMNIRNTSIESKSRI